MKKIYKYFVLLMIVLLITSCKDSLEEKIKYHPNGVISDKEYYNNDDVI